jgi:hypothetical protein
MIFFYEKIERKKERKKKTETHMHHVLCSRFTDTKECTHFYAKEEK